LETFTKSKELVFNPHFSEQRNLELKELDYNEIDIPIIELIKKISMLEYCFSLQSCHGHFLYRGQNNERNTEAIPIKKNIISVDYRIAYIAICIKESQEGKKLLNYLTKIPLDEPEYIQFGCAEWFWERQINSFVLQIEPKKFMNKDRVIIDFNEALYIEKIRNHFFVKMDEIFEKFVNKNYS
jgi:hypothetical protein